MQTMTCRRATVGPGDGVGAPVCGSGACGGHCGGVGGGNFSRIPLCRGSKRLLIIPRGLVFYRAAGGHHRRRRRVEVYGLEVKEQGYIRGWCY